MSNSDRERREAELRRMQDEVQRRQREYNRAIARDQAELLRLHQEREEEEERIRADERRRVQEEHRERQRQQWRDRKNRQYERRRNGGGDGHDGNVQ